MFIDIKKWNLSNVLFQAAGVAESLLIHPKGSGRRPLGEGPVARQFTKTPHKLGKHGESLLSISKIMSALNQSNGIARQNKYDIRIPTNVLKAASTNIFNLNKENLQFSDDATDWMNDFFDGDVNEQSIRLGAFCLKSQLPSYQFQMEQSRHYGPMFKIPHLPEYEDITMTFICGAQMLERYFFDAWMYMVMDPVTNNFNYIDEYAVNLDIVQYNEALVPGDDGTAKIEPNYTTTLIDAYPIAVNTQELAYDANDTFQTVQVTFTYRFAVPFTGKESSAKADRRSGDGKPELFSSFQAPDKNQQYTTTVQETFPK